MEGYARFNRRLRSNLPYHSILDREAKGTFCAKGKPLEPKCRTPTGSQRTPRQTSNLLNSETLRTLRPLRAGIYAFAAALCFAHAIS